LNKEETEYKQGGLSVPMKWLESVVLSGTLLINTAREINDNGREID
jgi:hypothetical protein